MTKDRTEEAANNLIEYFFTQKKIQILYAIAASDNFISIKILTEKLNFTFEEKAIFLGTEMNLYSLTESE